MKAKNRFIVCLALVLTSGCDSDENTDREIESIRHELDRIQTELDSIRSDDDRNGDGRPDFFIEHDGGFMYELYDRDFDGKVDESWKYDSNSNVISGRVDEDLDGILETEYLYKDFSLDKVLSDTNGNLIFDVYTKLDRGVMVYSEKYYTTKQGAKIGKVEYSFGYPVGPEVLVDTSISEVQFEDDRK
jgi:hypothetical protein